MHDVGLLEGTFSQAAFEIFQNGRDECLGFMAGDQHQRKEGQSFVAHHVPPFDVLGEILKFFHAGIRQKEIINKSYHSLFIFTYIPLYFLITII